MKKNFANLIKFSPPASAVLKALRAGAIIFAVGFIFLNFNLNKTEAAACTASVTGKWENTATWGGTCGGSGGIPGASDTIVINSGIVVTVDSTSGNRSVTSININSSSSATADGLTITPGSNTSVTVTVSGAVTFNANAGTTSTFNQTITLSADNGTGKANLTAGSIVIQAPTNAVATLSTINCLGTGTISVSGATSTSVQVLGNSTSAGGGTTSIQVKACTLSESNSAGGITVSGGTQTSATISSTSGTIAAGSAGTISVSGSTAGTALVTTATGTISANGFSIFGGTVAGSITTTGAGTLTTTNGVTFTGTAAQAKLTVANAAATFNNTGTIGSGGTVSLGASSTTKFTGTSAINGAYTIGGATQINGGTTTLGAGTITFTRTTLVADTATLSLGNFAFTQTGLLTVGQGNSGIVSVAGAGSTGNYQFSGGVTVAAGGTFNLSTGTHPVVLAGTTAITHNGSTFNTGTGAITFSGTGAMAFAGASNMTFGGTMTVLAGRTLTVSNSFASGITVAALTLAAAATANSVTINDGSKLNVTGALTFNANATATNEQVILGSGAGAGNLTVGSISMAAPIGAVASVEKIACGGTSAQSGTLTVTGSGAITINGSITASNTGTSGIDFSTGACSVVTGTTATTLTLAAGTGSTGATPSTIFKMGTGTATLNGALAFSGNVANKASFNMGVSGGTLVLAGGTLPAIGTPGSYTFTSTTNLTSTGTSAINYVAAISTLGTCTVSSGTLTFATGAIPNCTSVRVDSGATLALGSNLLTDTGNFTCGSGGAGTATISGSGGITISGNTSALGLTNGAGSTCAVTNSGTFLVSGSTPTLSANAAYTLSGSLSVSTQLTNSGTVTASNATSLTGAGNFINSTNAVLNIAGTSSGLTTLTPAASANTINYTGTAQTVHAAATNPYWHLGFSGTGSNTISLPASVTSIAGNLALSGTSAVTTGANLIVTGTTTIGDGTSLILGAFTFESDDKLTVGGGTSGTFTGTSGTGITLKGDLEIKAGSTFTKMTSGTVTFSKGAAQIITDSTSGCSTTATSCQEIGNVVTATASTSVSTATNIEISSLSIAGSTTFDISSDTVAVSGTSGPLITNSGTFTTTSSTVQIIPNASVTLTSGNITFNNLSLIPTLSSTSKAYTFGAGTLAIGGAFNINPIAASSLALLVTLGNSVTVTGATTITGTTSGTSSLILLNGSSWDLTTSSLTISSAGTLNASSASSTITLTGTGTVFSNSGTYTKGTDTIKFTDTSSSGKTFAGGGGTFNNFWYAPGTGTGTLTVTGANTYADFRDDGTGAHTIVFPSSTTQTIATLTLDTNASANITLQSSTSGTGQWTFSDPSGTNTVSYITIKDACVVNTGAVWDASNGTNTDGGNNCTGGTGWLFTNGISIAGSSNGSGTVAVAVNGTLQVGKTATISGSAWSITAVTTPSVNDIITVWIDGAADNAESTGVTKWSSGNITGMVLNTGVLTIGSSQNTSVSVTNLGLCDQDTGCSDEDIMHTSNSGSLLVDAGNVYTGDTLSILASNTLTVASGSTESITAEKLNNAGTITATGTPTITINGTSGTLFTNSGTFTQATSTVNLTGNGSATINSGSPTFYNLTSSGTGTKTLGAAITIASSGTLTVSNGTFDPSTFLVTGSGTNTLTVASGATLAVGASTFTGSYSAGFTTRTLTSGSTVDYNLSGPQTVDSTLTYSNLSTSTGNTKTFGGTTVINGNFTNGASVTLATGNNGLTFGGNFTNSGVALSAGSSAITINGTATQSIAGFTTTGTTTMSKTAGVATLQSAVSGNALTINGVGGTLNLGTSLTHTFTGAITVTNGTLDAGSSSVSTTALSSSNSNTRTIALGSGTWTLTSTGTVWDMATSTGATITAGSSTIKFTDTSSSSVTFAGGGKTFNNIYFNRGTSTGTNIITGADTFNDFKDDGTIGHTITFPSSTTTTVSTFTVTGSGAGNKIILGPSIAATTWTISDSSGINISDYLSISYSAATGGASWYGGVNSTNGTGNTGWIFTTPPCVSQVTNGYWNTAGTWACGHVPTTSDDATVQSGHTITMNTNSAVLGAVTVNGTLNTSDGSTRTLSGASLTIGASGTLNAIGDSITTTGDLSNAGTLNINKMTTYYRTITIDHTKVPNTDQTDFPVLISGTYSYLATIANGGKVQNGNGYDIGFYSDSGLTTKMKWEVEKYVPTTGEFVAWVKIPTLSHTSDNIIYMGYGNAGITTDQSDSANTWNSNFKSVWHMKETLTSSGQTVADSTSNGINLTSQGTWSSGQQVAGQVGGALNPLSANSDYLSFASQSLSSAYTIEGWVKITSQGAASVLFGNGGAGTNDTNWYNGQYRMWSGTLDDITSPNVTSTGVWKHFAITRTGTSQIMYENGSQVQTSAAGATRTFQYLGQGDGNLTSNIYYDEVRISTSVRAADWLATEYNNQNSPSTFYGVSSESNSSALITPASTSSYYRPITINPNSDKVPNTDQTDFPVLIVGTYDGSGGTADLRTVSNGGKVQNSNGYDVGFYSDSALTTKLKWETVSYSASTGAVEYWVKIPSLSHTASTVIYMGYGNASITTDQSDRANTWNTAFKGVLHFGDGTTLSTTDSSSYAIGSGTNNGVTATSGQIGGAGNFSNASINYGNNWGETGDLTIEGWGNATFWGQMMSKANAGSGLPGPIDMSFDGGTSQATLRVGDGSSGTGNTIRTTNTPPTSTWTYYAYKISGTSWAIRKNNAQDNSGTGLSQTRTNQSGYNMLVGFNNAGTEHFAGKIDELRISNTARSDDWLTTTYNNENSPSTFYTVGSEVAPSSSSSTTVTVGGNWTNTGTFYPSTSTVKLTYSGSSNTTFAGGGATYYNLWLAHGAGTGSYTITGSNTFNDLKDDGTGTHSILFTTGTTQHITTWHVIGTSGHLISINSTDTGTHALVRDGDVAVNADYLNIQHSVATPLGAWFAGTNSTDNNSVATAGSGWLFKLQTIYKGGGGGGGGELSSPAGSGASGTAVLTSNAVTSVTMGSGGSGYTIPPSVAFCGGGGTGATGTAVLTADAVTSVTINSGGSSYSSPPTVSFGMSCGGGGEGGGGSTTATGTPVLSGGTVQSVSMISNGSGYTTPPSVSFCANGGGGSGATGTAVLSNGTVASVTINNAGSGYSAAISVLFGSSCPTGGGGSGGGGGGDSGFIYIRRNLVYQNQEEIEPFIRSIIALLFG